MESRVESGVRGGSRRWRGYRQYFDGVHWRRGIGAKAARYESQLDFDFATFSSAGLFLFPKHSYPNTQFQTLATIRRNG